MPDPAAALSALAYEQASAALEQQRHALETLRGRAGTLLSSAALTTSLLGSRAVGSGAFRMTTWAAITCFAMTSAMSLAILWPRHELDTATRLPVIPAHDDDGRPRTIASIQQALVRYMRVAYDRNERQLRRIAIYARGGMILLAFEVISWVANLATST